MVNQLLSRISWSSFAILTVIMTITSSQELQSKQRSTPPAVLFDSKYGTHKWDTVNGIRLHYVEAGDRSKPLMLFVHGSDSRVFEKLLVICEMNRTVAIDMRGYGWSERPIGEKNYVLPYLIGDLKALIKHLNRKKAVVVSHDWGVLIVSAFVATNRHQLVHKYILMGGPPTTVFKQLIDHTMDQRYKSAYILGLLLRGVAESVLQALDYAFLSLLFKKEDLDVYKHVFSQPGALTAGLNYYRANFSLKKGKLDFTDNDFGDLLDGNNGMFILGGKDPFISQLSLNATAKEYPKMRVMAIPNAGHFLHQDEPEITNSLIRDFLGRTFH